MTDWDDDILNMDQADEDVIELTDIVQEGLDPATPEDIIELTDIVEDGTADFGLDIAQDEAVAGNETLEIEDSASFNKGLELEMDDPETELLIESQEEALEPAWQSNVSQEQVEAALERVIEKKFADKIETILAEVMEKVIEREIGQIKESLQKDLDGFGTV